MLRKVERTCSCNDLKDESSLKAFPQQTHGGIVRLEAHLISVQKATLGFSRTSPAALSSRVFDEAHITNLVGCIVATGLHIPLICRDTAYQIFWSVLLCEVECILVQDFENHNIERNSLSREFWKKSRYLNGLKLKALMMEGQDPAMEASTLAGGDEELICKTLQVEHKLFYFDLKENPRGRYLKISEKTSGSRSTIIVPIAGVVWFIDLFNYYANGNDPELSSKELQLDTKVFYFDVGENQRGRFLKVSEASVTRSRSTIIVPAGNATDDGWPAFRNILVEIHESSQLLFSPTKGSVPLQQASHAEHMGNLTDSVWAGFIPSSSSPLVSAISCASTDIGLPNVASSATATDGIVTARVIWAEQKKFFFDLGNNARGQYLRISEVTGVDRSAIILPALALEQFHETLGQFVDMVKSQGPVGSSTATVRTIAPPRKRSEG